MTGNYLITTDNWFIAPDGKYYRAAWGFVEILGDNLLGIKTNSHSSNWFAKIGAGDDHIIVAGCQIHYAIKCEKKPELGRVMDYHSDNKKGWVEKERPSQIYCASFS